MFLFFLVPSHGPRCDAVSRIAFTAHVNSAIRTLDPTTNFQLLLSMQQRSNCDEFEVLTEMDVKGLPGCNAV
jgi:hypothetical protein